MERRIDAFGRALLDWVAGGTNPEIVERDDGFIEAGAGPDVYLARADRWWPVERRALRHVRGRVLDVGCGAGRLALHLQTLGFDVVGLDSSPLAIRAARLHGVRRLWHAPVDALAVGVDAFDTLVLLGNNFGIFGTPERARVLLAEWGQRTGAGTRILAQSVDPHRGDYKLPRDYRDRNRGHGRMPGQVRLRIRYREWATPWFPWLFVSPAEMRRLMRGTGWQVRRVLTSTGSGPYVAVLEKTLGHPT